VFELVFSAILCRFLGFSVNSLSFHLPAFTTLGLSILHSPLHHPTTPSPSLPLLPKVQLSKTLLISLYPVPSFLWDIADSASIAPLLTFYVVGEARVVKQRRHAQSTVSQRSKVDGSEKPEREESRGIDRRRRAKPLTEMPRPLDARRVIEHPRSSITVTRNTTIDYSQFPMYPKFRQILSNIYWSCPTLSPVDTPHTRLHTQTDRSNQQPVHLPSP